MNFHKVCRKTIPSKFWQMQNHNAQESIHASFKWYEKEVPGLFLSGRSAVQYFIFQYVFNWFSSFLILFFLLHINVIYFGYFSKLKKLWM